MKNYGCYCMKGEEWKDIPGYEGIYQASNNGRIRSVDGKKTYSKKHGVRTWKGRIIHYKGHDPKTGYRVSLWKNKKEHSYLVARLVAATFLGKPKDFDNYSRNKKSTTVNHKDGNRFNNRINNLEWVTMEKNIKHAFETGLMPYDNIILKNKKAGVYFNSMAKASKAIGRSEGYISLCLKRNKVAKNKNGKVYEILRVKKGSKKGE